MSDPISKQNLTQSLSALEKLSFTQKQGFQVSWQQKLKEIHQEKFDQFDVSPLSIQKIYDGFDTFDTLCSLNPQNETTTNRHLFISQDLKLYLQTSDLGASSLHPLHHSIFDLWDSQSLTQSDAFLLPFLKPYLRSDENGYLELSAEIAILDCLIREIITRKKLIFLSEANPSTPNVAGNVIQSLKFEEEELHFRLQLEINSDKIWKIWGDFVTENNNTALFDLWSVKSIFNSFILTSTSFKGDSEETSYRTQKLQNNNKIYLLNENSDKLMSLARFLLTQGSLLILERELSEFFYLFYNYCGDCLLQLPYNVSVEQAPVVPQNILYLKLASPSIQSLQRVQAQCWFRYDKYEMPAQIHRSDKRKNCLKHKQVFDNTNQKYQLFLTTPDELTEEQWLHDFQSLSGVDFNSKKKVFELDLNNLHFIISLQLELGIEVWAENLKMKLLNQLKTNIHSLSDGGFLLEFYDSESKTTIESWQLIHILKKKSAFIKLDDGSLGVLPQKWIADLSRWLHNLSEGGELSSSQLLNFIKSEEDFSFDLQGDEHFESFSIEVRKFFESSTLRPQEPSSQFCGQLFDFQKHGLGWLLFLDQFYLGGLLADDMGLGKSIQVLAFLDKLKNAQSKSTKESSQPSLLIVPKSVLMQWQQSANKFTPHLKVRLLKPKELILKVKSREFQFYHDDLLITTYGVLRRYANLFNQFSFERLILDEAQIIKNEKSQVSLAAKSIKTKKRLALSGTPIENHIGDFYSLFEFLNPGMLSRQFLNLTSEGEIKKSLSKLKPLILHRKKETLLTKLPGKFEKTIPLPLKKEQAEIYNRVKKHFSNKLKELDQNNDFENYKFLFLEGLLRLRQICCDPNVLFSTDETTLTLNSTKTEYLLDELKKLQTTSCKVLVFSQFTSYLKLIRKELDKAEISYLYLDGQTEDRQSLVNEFQNNPEPKIFLMGLKAGGLGLNLTSANYCYILDPWWNPATENQAIDRIYRIGQTKDVYVYRLLAQGTIEEKIQELHKLKSEQAQLLQISENEFLNSLSHDDFKNIFN